MCDPQPTKPFKVHLAEEHWQFIEGLLDSAADVTYGMTFLEYLYIEAFLHGWRHAEKHLKTMYPPQQHEE